MKTRWYLSWWDDVVGLTVEELGDAPRGIIAAVFTRKQARAMLPELRAELERRIRRADADPVHTYDPVEEL